MPAPAGGCSVRPRGRRGRRRRWRRPGSGGAEGRGRDHGRGRGGAVAAGQCRLVEEPAALGPAVAVVPGPRAVVVAQRPVQVQRVQGPGQRDVEQPPLLVQALDGGHAHVRGAAAPGPEQHGLVAQPQPPLPGGEHPGAHLLGLGRLVRAVDQLRTGAAAAGGDQRLVVPDRGAGPGRVGQVEHGLRGAVVADQPDHRRAGELRRQVEDVPGAGPAEPVHGLGVVADRGQPGVPRVQSARTRSSRSAASAGSITANPPGSPSAVALAASTRCATEWKVPPQGRVRRSTAARDSISAAAG